MNFQLTEEHRQWQRAVRDFVEAEVKSRARHTDENAEFNWPAARKMGPLGLLGLNAAEEYGGSGIDALGAAIAIEELGRGCGSTALAVAAHNGLACAPISAWGTPAQKERFLRPLASGSQPKGSCTPATPFTHCGRPLRILVWPRKRATKVEAGRA